MSLIKLVNEGENGILLSLKDNALAPSASSAKTPLAGPYKKPIIFLYILPCISE